MSLSKISEGGSDSRKRNSIDKLSRKESGYEDLKNLSSSEALNVLKEEDEPSIEELREQRHERLSKDFNQEIEANDTMALAFKEAGFGK